MAACGLDFGTSNSAIGVMRDDLVELAPLEDGHLTIPSALFFDFATDEVLFGREAIDAYISDHDGRLMRAIKSVLGTALMTEKTQLNSHRITFTEVITTFVKHLKKRAESHCGQELKHVVHGRPVHFVDDDRESDIRAEATIREIAMAAGFDEVTFQYEPIAAALHYERGVNREEVALVADIGGGTSDFSVLRLGPDRLKRFDRSSDILANDGIRLGGTDFDRVLSLDKSMPILGMGTLLRGKDLPIPKKIFSDLSTWSRINQLYTQRILGELRAYVPMAYEPEKLRRLLHVVEHHHGHRLAIEVERAKIRLSEIKATAIEMSCAEPGLQAPVTRNELLDCMENDLDRLRDCIRNCLSSAGLRPDEVEKVILTGGSTLLPAVRDAILATLPKAQAFDEDTFQAVGLGLTEEARRRYRE